MADWRSGTLVGSGYSFVVDGKAVAHAKSREELREQWGRTTEKMGEPRPFPEHLVKQICYVLPPWEKSDDRSR